MADYKLSYTGDQINAAIGRSLMGEVQNLLDNSNFKNPVNQRGKTSYSGKASAYTIDRWYASTAGVSINIISSGINIDNRSNASATGHMTQRVSKLTDGTYTLFVNTSDGMLRRTFTVASGTANTGTFVNGTNAFTAVGYSSGILTVQIGVFASKVVTVYWAALYAGSYDANTMPQYVSNPFAVEELTCMRYYQMRSTNNVPVVDLRPPMYLRENLTAPTITALSDGTYAYSADL